MLVKGDSIIVMWNRSSSVSIAITIQAEQLISSRGKKRALDSVSAVFGPRCVQWVLGAFCLGVKYLAYETEHPPPLACIDKNAWSHAIFPQYIFIALCFIQHKASLTLQYNNSNIINLLVLELNACSRPQFNWGLHRYSYNYVTFGICALLCVLHYI